MIDLQTGASDETTYSSIPLTGLEMSGEHQKDPMKSSRSNNL